MPLSLPRLHWPPAVRSAEAVVIPGGLAGPACAGLRGEPAMEAVHPSVSGHRRRYEMREIVNSIFY